MPSNDAAASDTVPVKERDYLDQDPPVRGQRYACMSFVAPEDVLADKATFVMGRFLRSLAADVSNMLDSLDAKYGTRSLDDRETIAMVRSRHAYLWSDEEMQSELRTYRTLKGPDLDDEFHSSNGFQTSLRGFKVRGVYESVDEATDRAKSIRKFDDKFNVFIAEVGCWCPFNPTPESIRNAEYVETELNTLMKAYKEGQDKRDSLYEERKANMLDQLAKDRDEWLRHKQDELAQTQAHAQGEADDGAEGGAEADAEADEGEAAAA